MRIAQVVCAVQLTVFRVAGHSSLLYRRSMNTRIFNVGGQRVGVQVIPASAVPRAPPASVTVVQSDIQHAAPEAEVRKFDCS